MASKISRWLLLLGLSVAPVAMGVACSSSSHHSSEPTPTNDSGIFTFDTNVIFDAVQSIDAPYVKCGTETCTRGDICVMDLIVGGADTGVIESGASEASAEEAGANEAGAAEAGASEAGACPSGEVVPEGGGSCGQPPTYHCKGLPSACGGAPDCSCASSLCDPGFACQSAAGLVLSCQQGGA